MQTSPRLRPQLLIVAAAAVLLTACTQDVTGTAVRAAGAGPDATGGDQTECVSVSAPLDDIPTEDDTEPLLRIPVPDGWERNTMMDNDVIRYSIVSSDLVADGFATNAVVTLESVRGSQDPAEVFDQNRANLETGLGAFDLETVDTTTCGLPAETTYYIAPRMGSAPERPVVMHAVVAEDGGYTFLATLTIQTTEPDNPQYIDDTQEIVDGFQMVLPDS